MHNLHLIEPAMPSLWIWATPRGMRGTLGPRNFRGHSHAYLVPRGTPPTAEPMHLIENVGYQFHRIVAQPDWEIQNAQHARRRWHPYANYFNNVTLTLEQVTEAACETIKTKAQGPWLQASTDRLWAPQPCRRCVELQPDTTFLARIRERDPWYRLENFDFENDDWMNIDVAHVNQLDPVSGQ